jgi:hypothetical protein
MWSLRSDYMTEASIQQRNFTRASLLLHSMLSAKTASCAVRGVSSVLFGSCPARAQLGVWVVDALHYVCLLSAT